MQKRQKKLKKQQMEMPRLQKIKHLPCVSVPAAGK